VEIQTKGIEHQFSIIRAENFPALRKYVDIKVQEAFRIPNIHNKKRASPCHVIDKMAMVQKKKEY
jgi:hypothetical protein